MFTLHCSRFALLCLLLTLSFACAAKANPPPTPTPDAAPATPATPTKALDLRVLTYNLNYGNTDWDEIEASIRAANADVVALQEVTADAATHLPGRLRDLYPHTALRPAQAASGFALLSRHPITSEHHLEPEFGFFGTQVATLDIGGQPVQLLNVHLQPALPKRGDGPLQIAQTVFAMERVRAQEIQRILAERAPELPALMLGDFNTLSILGVISTAHDAGFLDTAPQVLQNPDTEHPTWHWRLPSDTVRYRIDYILHSHHWQTTAHQVFYEGSSDHFPVVAALRWNATP